MTNAAAVAFTTVDRVKESLGLGPFDSVDDAWLDAVVDAVNVCICRDWRPDICRLLQGGGTGRGGDFAPADFAFTDYVTGTGGGSSGWLYTKDPRLELGATLLAQRWYTRRNGQEVASFNELGGPLPAIDRDIALLIGIQSHFRPVVA